MSVKPDRSRPLQWYDQVITQRMTSDALAGDLGKSGIYFGCHLAWLLGFWFNIRVLILRVRLINLFLVFISRVGRRLLLRGARRGLAFRIGNRRDGLSNVLGASFGWRVVVAVQQGRHAFSFLRRVERVTRNAIDVNLLDIKRKLEQLGVFHIVHPGSKPLDVSARYEVAGHIGELRSDWLKHSEEPRVPDGPRRQREDKPQRERRSEGESA